MPTFRSVKELLQTLHRHRSLIQDLFLNRNQTVSVENILSLVKDERAIYSLDAKNLLHRKEEMVQLDERLLHFLEEVLEVNEEIQSHKIDERVETLQDNIQFFLNEENWRKKEKYLQRIQQNFTGLGKIIRRNVIDLGKKIQHDYKTEENFKNKKLKIDRHNERSKLLEKLIEEVYQILGNRLFFAQAEDFVLRQLVIDLKYDLQGTRRNLIELQQEIIRYLNKIDEKSQIFEKLQVLKRWKDVYELESKSNIEEVLREQEAVFLNKRPMVRSRPSLDFLASDEGYDLAKRVAKRQQHKLRYALQQAGEMQESYLETGKVEEKRINYAGIRDKFLESSQDLFCFVLEYPFQIEFTQKERIDLFCKVALLYDESMHYTGQTRLYIWDKEDGTQEKVRYALIYGQK